MLLEEVNLIESVFLLGLASTIVLSLINPPAFQLWTRRALRGLQLISILCLYLSLVGGFIMIYMAVARYFQIIF